MLEIHLTNKKMFSEEEIQQIKKLFKDELAVDVSDEKACQHMEQFLNLLLATYKEPPDLSSNSPP